MENKNLNDIVIEDADSSKKAQFKNILTLLALLFIILVISIVITKLILGNDDENSDLNYIKTENVVDGTSEANASNASTSTLAVAGVAAAGAALATTAALSSTDTKEPAVTERNTSSRKKLTLRDHRSSDDKAEKKPTVTKKSTYTRPKYTAPKDRTQSSIKKRYTSTAPAARVPLKASRGYYIKVGTFKDTTTAIKKIKALKLNYKKIVTKEGATRVLIGPFYSRKDAQNHLGKAKASISPDAYITKIK